MSKKFKISNIDIIPLALYDLEGVGKFVDVEDMFYRCYEIAPERFSWRKYKFPNYKILYKALVDFENKYTSFLMKTPDGLSRQLTAEGVEWIERRLPVFNELLKTPEKVPPSRRPNQRILNDIRDHILFKLFSEGKNPSLDKYEVSELLLCSPDSPTELWRERLETYRALAQETKRKDLASFLTYILNKKPAWFGG